MSDIKPIETRYKGYRFRSRLEARWAVFFDAAGIEYQYEPQGFEKTYDYDPEWDEEKVPPVRYLPDFYLPKTETWVEVKGCDEALRADRDRLSTILDYNSPLPGMRGSGVTNAWYGKTNGLLVLGDVPYIPNSSYGPVFHPIIQHDKGLWWRWALIETRTIHVIDPYDVDGSLLGYIGDRAGEPDDWTTGALVCNTGFAIKRIVDAYRAARSARFEHGECG